MGWEKNPWSNTLCPNITTRRHPSTLQRLSFFLLFTPRVDQLRVFHRCYMHCCARCANAEEEKSSWCCKSFLNFKMFYFWKITSALEFALPRYRRSNSSTGLLWIWNKNQGQPFLRWSEKCFSLFKSIPLSVLWHSTPPLHSLHLSSIPVQSFIIQFYSQRKNWQKLLSAFLHLSTMTITGLVVPASPHAIAPGIDVSTLCKVVSEPISLNEC